VRRFSADCFWLPMRPHTQLTAGKERESLKAACKRAKAAGPGLAADVEKPINGFIQKNVGRCCHAVCRRRPRPGCQSEKHHWPAAVYEYKDEDNVSFNLRAQMILELSEKGLCATTGVPERTLRMYVPKLHSALATFGTTCSID
jgi:hypothetical protein